MMEFRNSDSRHVDWVKALKQVFQQLKAYVKQHHMAGPTWNANGIPFKDYKPGSSGAAAPSPEPAAAQQPQPPGKQLCSLNAVSACHLILLVFCMVFSLSCAGSYAQPAFQPHSHFGLRAK